ncbi:MAG: HAD-IIB family hydrolase [Gammaproteobacteria bacterium]|jgi:HAD superfamily hydrolase (TIGR01484 family)
MRIIATDLDRTLLPNGHWPADPEAIPLFNKLSRRDDVLLVYVTGRNLDLTEAAIRKFGVRHPDILCGDVGTTIRKFQEGRWHFDTGWEALVHRASPRWDAEQIRQALAGIDGIVEQEPEHLNQFKQSYYTDHDRTEEILAAVHKAVGEKFDEVIVYSFDSQEGKGLLDLLPASATKQTALEYVAREYGQPLDRVVFCGDSGNDIFPLTAGFAGVLVRNADEQLVEKVRHAMQENPDLQVYFAKGDFKGLSGYYTSGVIEGCFHYGVFSDSNLR